jgi:hypothetical protein
MRKTRNANPLARRIWIALPALAACALLFLTLFKKPVPPPAPPLQNADPACRAAYLDLYSRDVIDFRMVFGYKDARPARFVGDRYERNSVIERIEKLGFARDAEDDDLFVRSLLGPDGKPKAIQLRLLASSAGPDDVANRDDPYQAWKSEEASSGFYSGLKHADVVFYNGHSRLGGGPDFEPPKLAGGSHVEYGSYSGMRLGYLRMVEALRAGSPGPKVVGLFSCVSDRHFSEGILKANPRTALLATETLMYFSDSLESSLEALEGLIQMRCQQDFHPTGTHLMRFFLEG